MSPVSSFGFRLGVYGSSFRAEGWNHDNVSRSNRVKRNDYLVNPIKPDPHETNR